MTGFDPVQVQFDIAARLRVIPSLSAVTFVTEEVPTMAAGERVLNAIQIALAAASTGAGVLIMAGELSGTTIDQPLYFNRVAFDLTCFTSDPLNEASGGANTWACTLAARCGVAMHGHKSPPLYNPWQFEVLQQVRIGSLPEPLNKEFDSRIFKAWNARIFTQMEQPIPARCAAPTVSVDITGEIITLASTTGTAKIYYTVNGKSPYSTEPTATLYTAPFTPSAACTIRAAAQDSSNLLDPSDIISFDFTP